MNGPSRNANRLQIDGLKQKHISKLLSFECRQPHPRVPGVLSNPAEHQRSVRRSSTTRRVYLQVRLLQPSTVQRLPRGLLMSPTSVTLMLLTGLNRPRISPRPASLPPSRALLAACPFLPLISTFYRSLLKHVWVRLQVT